MSKKSIATPGKKVKKTTASPTKPVRKHKMPDSHWKDKYIAALEETVLLKELVVHIHERIDGCLGRLRGRR